MKVIRRSVFETNSSSTHSISIRKWTPTKESAIPINSNIKVEGAISAQTEIKDELGKLNYIACILASIIESDYYDGDCEKQGFNEMISTNRFAWLAEVVKETRNTDVTYVKDDNDFPYFETTYDDTTDIRKILGCDIDDKDSFKKRVGEIIFDENYIIEDKENEY